MPQERTITMITINELNRLMPEDYELAMVYHGGTTEINRKSEVEMKAYGSFLIESFQVYSGGESEPVHVEATLAVKILKEGEAE